MRNKFTIESLKEEYFDEELTEVEVDDMIMRDHLSFLEDLLDSTEEGYGLYSEEWLDVYVELKEVEKEYSYFGVYREITKEEPPKKKEKGKTKVNKFLLEDVYGLSGIDNVSMSEYEELIDYYTKEGYGNFRFYYSWEKWPPEVYKPSKREIRREKQRRYYRRLREKAPYAYPFVYERYDGRILRPNFKVKKYKKNSNRVVRRNNIPYKGKTNVWKKEYDLWWTIF